MGTAEANLATDFIREAVAEDLRAGRFDGGVVTRFPPEPNGFLHIGHAKAICINFGVAAAHDGITHLRFDDTNPTKEEDRFVAAIKQDVHWLGFDWDEHEYFASDYYETLYDYAVTLIRKGTAFVCDLSADEVRAHRGTLTEPGRESPWRKRGVEENLDLFARMRAGEFADGQRTLRAKIDMASPNVNMRDPVIYRILHATHHRTGDDWCIYPMYDFAHGQSDSIEGITHSLCTLEFEDHRPLYDWFLDALEIHHPRQIEFARLNLSYFILSKRRLVQLDDPGVQLRQRPAQGLDLADAAAELAVLDGLVEQVEALAAHHLLELASVGIEHLDLDAVAVPHAVHQVVGLLRQAASVDREHARAVGVELVHQVQDQHALARAKAGRQGDAGGELPKAPVEHALGGPVVHGPRADLFEDVLWDLQVRARANQL